MGLSSQFKMSDLARLAQSNNPEHRDQLLIALGSLCALNPLDDSATDAAVSQIMFILYPKANADTRQMLSKSMSQVAWASHQLIIKIAQDVAPIAKPVITLSPVLRDADLIDIANNAGADHRMLIAGRPNISENVTGTLTRQDEPDVLAALIDNSSAKLSMESFATCVRVSRRAEPLRTKLSVREDMPRSLIPSLFAYSDDALRKDIAKRFEIDGDHLSAVVKDAIIKKPEPAAKTHDQKMEEAAHRLVDKLAQSERLTAAFIIKSLNDKKIVLFEYALARLAGVGVNQIRQAFARDALYALALSCRAARIDRSVFPTIHSALHSAGWEIHPLAGEEGNKAANAYGNHSPAAAAVALRLLSREA